MTTRDDPLRGVKVVSAEDAEKADICVCMRVGTGDETRFDDNEYGVCADCGHAIYHRPSMPRKPPKVCVPCGYKRAGIALPPVYGEAEK